ncbi:MAG: sulfite exporter TauE/SafE family protein [Armatimonadetes bacterium]|nr:sulfite exporter TauE/SafE family protein [Armatimonadota bacterium]MBS1726875.1 sulfite exporter TauE/SafE family protein [Armatimonadota bacterium]
MGFVLGLLGGGGGILTVPILVGFFGLTATEATGSSLFVVGLTSTIGAGMGVAKKQTEVGPAILLAIPSMIGALASRRLLVPMIPNPILGVTKDQFLLGAFSVLMIVVGIRMFMKKKEGHEPKHNPILVVIYGLMIGVLSGTLGAGGGFLILPVLTLLLGVEMEKAIPTSLLVICIQSLGGFLGELGKPIDWKLLLSIAFVALFGMGIGLTLRERAPRKTLQLAFAYMVFAVAAWMIFRTVSMNHSPAGVALHR